MTCHIIGLHAFFAYIRNIASYYERCCNIGYNLNPGVQTVKHIRPNKPKLDGIAKKSTEAPDHRKITKPDKCDALNGFSSAKILFKCASGLGWCIAGFLCEETHNLFFLSFCLLELYKVLLGQDSQGNFPLVHA